MIQEKDFLYRVPVKNALVTAPGKQVRNPEILVDLEGGEFMHGNILDANSTNKLIDQSVKDAIDNSIENGNYVTKDLLEAETSDFVSKTATDIQTIESDLDLRQRLLVNGMDSYIYISGSNDYTGENINNSGIKVRDSVYRDMYTSLDQSSITINNKTENIFICAHYISSRKLDESRPSGFGDNLFLLNENGVRILNGDDYHVLTSDCSTIDIREYARRSELPTTATKESLGVVKVGDGLNVTDGTISVDTTVLPAVPTNVSQLTNDSNFITQQDADAKYASANSLNTVNDSVSSLRVGLSKKQDKITVNSVDVTDIETADITKLRTIVRNLIDALNTSGLIRTNSNIE